MNLSWGKAIFAVYGLFIIGVIIVVSISMTKNVDLVAPNYYDKEIRYQEEIDKINNTNRLKEQVQYEINEKTITVTFPFNTDSSEVRGEIFFFRPSDSKMDFKEIIETDNKFRQVLDIRKIEKGLWKVKVFWNMDGIEYLSTTIFMKP